jgi:TPR repeat protein
MKTWVVPVWLMLCAAAVAVAQDHGFEAYQAGRFEQAFAALVPLAEKGDANAQYVLGIMYARGQGVEQSFYEAGKMYRLAAEQGHAGAQINLGSLFENCYGNGPCDTEEGADWYRRAADQGDAIGQHNLAVMYAAGEGVARDEWSARILFRKSAEQGHLPAQYNLGVIYERGMGGPVDRVAAWAWYDVSAQRGFDGALGARDRLAGLLTTDEFDRANALSDTLLAAYGGN